MRGNKNNNNKFGFNNKISNFSAKGSPEKIAKQITNPDRECGALIQ